MKARASANLVLAKAPLVFEAGSGAQPSGWVLVESAVGHQAPYSSAMLRLRRRLDPSEVLDIQLPISLAGTVHELIRLPEDVAELCWQPPRGAAAEEPRLTVRRVGWLERIARMAYRIFWIRAGLAEEMRRSAGLTLWRSLRDIEGAYRNATAFRARPASQRYADWIECFDALREHDVARIRSDIARFAMRPRFRVVVLAGKASPQELRATLASLRAQLYDEFASATVDAAGVFDPSIWRGGDWLMVLRAGDVLPPHALYWFAREALARPDSVLIYADDDRVDSEGRRSDPRFKPDWSPAHFESSNYLGAAAIVRGSAAQRAGGLTLECCRHGNYDLMLRAIDACGDAVRHIPAILLHRADATAGAAGADGADSLEDPQWCAEMLDAHFRRRGVAAHVETAPSGRRRIRYRLPDAPPLVSIIVPTRDALALLRQCVESVLHKTSYPRYELLIVDNQSTDAATLDYLADVGRRPGVRVLEYRKPFNFAAINNYAAREAVGDVLCLLNNDTEIIAPDWLDEMAGHLLQPQVAVVGAKLYYPDGRVQHAGVTVGPGGCANHLHAGIARDDPGYCGRAILAQEYSAVTAACLLTWKRLWLELGGLNERRLPVTFNDVDYCLRVLEAGYRVVFTPHAELCHFESATRGRDVTLRKRLRLYRELKYMRTRWRKRMNYDPYYNPNLSYRRPDFSLTERPRVARPWSNTAL